MNKLGEEKTRTEKQKIIQMALGIDEEHSMLLYDEEISEIYRVLSESAKSAPGGCRSIVEDMLKRKLDRDEMLAQAHIARANGWATDEEIIEAYGRYPIPEAYRRMCEFNARAHDVEITENIAKPAANGVKKEEAEEAGSIGFEEFKRLYRQMKQEETRTSFAW